MTDLAQPAEKKPVAKPKRRERKLSAPAGMPVLPQVRGEERAALAAWMRERLEEIEVAHAKRIELLRNVGEHPSPVFAKIVRIDGALGMPKSLVAKKLGMTISALDMYYGDEYELGAAEVIANVAANALRIATSTTDPNAARLAMQVLDRRGGDEWRPPAQKVEMSNEDEAPPVIDSSRLTPQEREQLRVMLTRIAQDQPSEGADLGSPVERGDE